MATDNPNKIHTLFIRYCTNNVTADEARQVEQLTSESESLREELQDVRYAIELQRDMTEYRSFDIHAAFRKTSARLKKNRMALFVSRFSKVAAILLIPLCISTLLLGYLCTRFYSGNDVQAYCEVSSAPGVVTRIELPDQSEVWLNSASTIRYPSRFSKGKREVELSGEGYFKVESDKKNPFYVTTPTGFRVMAHGTQFNVSAYTDDISVETVLVQGKLDAFSSDKRSLQMNAQDMVICNKVSGQLTLSKINPYEKTAWKDGKLVFRNTPLDDVFKQLSRRFNVEIIIHGENSTKHKCRATFTNENITQILNYLKQATSMEWTFSEPDQKADYSFNKQKIDIWIK